MGKPRVKLKAAQARKPPAQSRNLDRAHHLLAEAVGMTPAEVLRKPYEARDRFKRKQAQHQQAQARFAAQLAPALNMTAQQVATASKEEIERRLDEMKKQHIEKVLGEEHARIGAIIKACQVTGQNQLLAKLVENGSSEEEATAHIFDVAAAHSDGQSINNSHSPEGGHKAGIDYAKIYDRQNSRKERRA